MVGVSFVIYSINQKALEKELVKFTEHSVEAIYKELNTEMSWQRRQAEGMKTHILRTYSQSSDFAQSARGVFTMDSDFEAIGFYDAEGQLLASSYRRFAELSPEMRLAEQIKPQELFPPEKQKKKDNNLEAPPEPLFEVLTFGSGDPKENPYYLRTLIPVGNGLTVHTAKTKKEIAYYAQLKQFTYLTQLIHANSVYEGLYVIDKNGYIIAGPKSFVQGETPRHISRDDYRFFNKLKPGVTEAFSTTSQTVAEKNYPDPPKDDDDDPKLEKVFLKIPEINWGIIIESPYQIRQTYVRRAHVQSLLLVASALGLVIILSLVYAYGINRNFRQLIKGIQAMAMGNYSRRIRLITNMVTPHEIIYVTGEFNRMARKMSEAWSDIQEANKKLAQMDQMKSNLIDTVSHELRTPLTSIKGYTSRLLRYDHELDTETRKKSLRVVKQQADRLGRLVEDLLVIPDLESATLRVFPDQVNLHAVIDHSVQTVQAKGNREIVVNSPESELSVLADPDRLEQILVNLLDNAVKYSSPDSLVTLSVQERPETSMAELIVENECPPMPDDIRENPDQLFEKFKRLDESLIRTTRGSGLGLFITKGLVETMGGEISLRTEGNRFITVFTIPLYQSLTSEAVV